MTNYDKKIKQVEELQSRYVKQKEECEDVLDNLQKQEPCDEVDCKIEAVKTELKIVDTMLQWCEKSIAKLNEKQAESLNV